MCQHLSATDSHAAACVPVELAVLLYCFHDLLCSHHVGYRLKRFCIACFCAFKTDIAFFSVYIYLALAVYEYRFLRAFFYAAAALYAAVRHPYELLKVFYELRVMTPAAVQRTALQKDGRPYAGTVFCREFLYAAYRSRERPALHYLRCAVLYMIVSCAALSSSVK